MMIHTIGLVNTYQDVYQELIVVISINAIKLDNILLSLYIALNFADRKIAYFFLIALLLKCIYNYFFISKNKHNNIILAVGLFSSWISLSAYINNVPLHELDNYFRFLLLLPLLFINLRNTNLQGIIFSRLFSLDLI